MNGRSVEVEFVSRFLSRVCQRLEERGVRDPVISVSCVFPRVCDFNLGVNRANFWKTLVWFDDVETLRVGKHSLNIGQRELVERVVELALEELESDFA